MKISYLVLGLGGVVGEEGRLGHQHLVHDNPEAPPVAQLGVALAQQHLRRNVVGRADKAVRQAAGVLPLLAPPLQRLHATVGGGGTGAAAAVKVKVARVHRVLPAVPAQL